MKTSNFPQFEHHAALAFFASAYADLMEENGEPMGGEIMDQLPDVIDPAAEHAAKILRVDIERLNGKTIDQLMALIVEHGDGDRPETVECFGHYAAMQAMGHGVGLYDAFGDYVHDTIKVPYVEFGSHSLINDHMSDPGICPTCNGSGEGYSDGSRCNACKGKGEI